MYLPIYSSCIPPCSPRTEVREYLLSSHSLLISFNEYGPLDWTGIFDWYFQLDSSLDLDLDQDLDLQWTRAGVAISFFANTIAHRLVSRTQPPCTLRRVSRRQVVSYASRSSSQSHEACMRLHDLRCLHVFDGPCT